MTEIRGKLLRILEGAVERYLPHFDAGTGRFLTDPEGPLAPGAGEADLRWAVTNQDILYHLAVVHREPASRYCGDAGVLETACRAGDAIRDAQYPDGRMEFVKTDGSKWGPYYACWTNYAWLETYALLADRLTAQRRRRWEEGLRLAYEGHEKELRAAVPHNIPCWNAMGLYRAGQVFGRPEWMDAGRAMIARVASSQKPGGYWAEHEGPTTLYNLVYVHALGLYHVFSGDPSVLPALREAVDFHSTFQYPDGRLVETVDGRVKYSDRIAGFALAAFSLTPEGRRLARHWIDGFDVGRDFSGPQGGILASAYLHFRDGEERPMPLDAPRFLRNWQDRALVMREGKWFCCLSAFVSPPVASRWGQDRQAFLSLWHGDAGLLVGGGNSKDQPEWSSFIADGRFVPERGELLKDGSGEPTGIVLTYGRVRCLLDIRLAPGEAVVEAWAEGGPAVQNLLLHLKRGAVLSTAAGAAAADGAIDWRTERLGKWLRVGNCRIEVPHSAHLRWPSHPFNPYAIDGAPPPGSEMGILSVPIEADKVRWRFSFDAGG